MNRSIFAQVALYSVLLGLPRVAHGEDKLRACNVALNACNNVIWAEDQANLHLKAQVKELEEQISEQSQPLIPNWAWGVAGVVLGGASMYMIKR
jgi:hypothetical protein